LAQRTFKTDALILFSRPLGEADRLVTFLSWDRGKFTAVAKGARKTMSKLAAGVDLFTCGHYQFYQGRHLATLTGQEVREHFHYFRENPKLYPYGLYLAELADRLAGHLIGSEESFAAACVLLQEGWRLLGEELDKALLCRAYELKFIALSGHCPYLNGCLHCGCTVCEHFSPRQGGLICRKCATDADGFIVQPGSSALARRLLQAPLNQVKRIRIQPSQHRELTQMTSSFMRYHLEIHGSKSLRLLKLFPDEADKNLSESIK